MEDIDRLHKGLVDKECPDCQSNMLTKADYRAAKRIWWKLKVIEIISNLIIRMYPSAGVGTLQVRVKDGQVFSEMHRDKPL